MTRFIGTTDFRRFINLDHVETATAGKDPRGHGVYELKNAKGEWLGFADDNIDLELISAPIVPAAPNTMATSITVFCDPARPTEEDILVEREPIIAWRVLDTHAVPVFADSDVSNRRRLIELPNGCLLDQGTEGTYRDLDAAKAAALADAQNEWDSRKRTAKDAA